MVSQAISQAAIMMMRRRRRKRGAARSVGAALVIKAISHKARWRNIKRCEQRRRLHTNLTQLLLEEVIFLFKEQIEFPASDETRNN